MKFRGKIARWFAQQWGRRATLSGAVGKPDIEQLRKSQHFDAAWYLLRYPDIATAGADPALHYLEHGATEGRDPGPYFSTRYYSVAYPDVAASGLNPLLHFIRHGSALKRLTQPQRSDAQGSSGLLPANTFNNFSLGSADTILAHMRRTATPAERLAHASDGDYSPLISIIVPLFNTPPNFFWEMLNSVLGQIYSNWELQLVDDGSTDPAIGRALETVKRSGDARIKIVRSSDNGGIAKATDLGIMKATGEFLAFLDHDDLLVPSSLAEVVTSLREDDRADFIYTDHAMISADGAFKHFSRKPTWSPEFLLSTNYIVHLKVVRRALLAALGGTKDATPNVQDLEMSLKLARAGARTRYLPRICYLWREHSGSVASSSAAKHGIEQLLVAAYDKHLRLIGSSARQTWPNGFQADRIGVFKLDFSATPLPSAAIIVRMGRDAGAPGETRDRIRFMSRGRFSVYLMDFDGQPSREGVVRIAGADQEQSFYAGLNEETLLFVDGSARDLGLDWAQELLGYLTLDDAIGAVGGKVLNEFLRVKAGGVLIDDDGVYRAVCGDEFDDCAGHWFLNEIASNVDGVTSRLLATRRKLVLETGALQISKYGDAAAVFYCEALRQRELRVVYNPWAKIYDAARIDPCPAATAALERPSASTFEGRAFPRDRSAGQCNDAVKASTSAKQQRESAAQSS